MSSIVRENRPSWWLVWLALWSSGCSFAFVETVPDGHASQAYFDCTSNPGLAVADGVLALGSAAGAAVALSKSKEEYADYNNDMNRDIAAGVNIGAAAVFAASGVYGLIQSLRCSSAKRDLRRRLLGSEDPDAPAPIVDRERRPLSPASPEPAPSEPTPPAPAELAPSEPAQPEPIPGEVQSPPAPDAPSLDSTPPSSR
jgi:hypothetical protein